MIALQTKTAFDSVSERTFVPVQEFRDWIDFFLLGCHPAFFFPVTVETTVSCIP
jgi:hypothetical protein